MSCCHYRPTGDGLGTAFLPVEGEGVEDSQRMVALLVDGLRYGAARQPM